MQNRFITGREIAKIRESLEESEKKV